MERQTSIGRFTVRRSISDLSTASTTTTASNDPHGHPIPPVTALSSPAATSLAASAPTVARSCMDHAASLSLAARPDDQARGTANSAATSGISTKAIRDAYCSNGAIIAPVLDGGADGDEEGYDFRACTPSDSDAIAIGLMERSSTGRAISAYQPGSHTASDHHSNPRMPSNHVGGDEGRFAAFSGSDTPGAPPIDAPAQLQPNNTLHPMHALQHTNHHPPYAPFTSTNTQNAGIGSDSNTNTHQFAHYLGGMRSYGATNAHNNNKYTTHQTPHYGRRQSYGAADQQPRQQPQLRRLSMTDSFDNINNIQSLSHYGGMQSCGATGAHNNNNNNNNTHQSPHYGRRQSYGAADQTQPQFRRVSVTDPSDKDNNTHQHDQPKEGRVFTSTTVAAPHVRMPQPLWRIICIVSAYVAISLTVSTASLCIGRELSGLRKHRYVRLGGIHDPLGVPGEKGNDKDRNYLCVNAAHIAPTHEPILAIAICVRLQSMPSDPLRLCSCISFHGTTTHEFLLDTLRTPRTLTPRLSCHPSHLPAGRVLWAHHAAAAEGRPSHLRLGHILRAPDRPRHRPPRAALLWRPLRRGVLMLCGFV